MLCRMVCTLRVANADRRGPKLAYSRTYAWRYSESAFAAITPLAYLVEAWNSGFCSEHNRHLSRANSNRFISVGVASRSQTSWWRLAICFTIPCNVTYEPKVLRLRGGVPWGDERFAIAAEKRIGGLKLDCRLPSHASGVVLIHSGSSQGRKQSLISRLQRPFAVWKLTASALK